MFTVKFWKKVARRAVRTFAQTAAAVLSLTWVGSAAVDTTGPGLLDVNWVKVVSLAGLAAVYSVLTSVGAEAKRNGRGAPS